MLRHDPRLRPTMQEVADHPFFTDELTSFEVSPGQVDHGISEQDHPGQDSAEILERTFSPAVETIPKEFTSMSFPPFAPDIFHSASGNLHAMKLEGSLVSGFSQAKRRKEETPRYNGETSTSGVSEPKKRKEGTPSEDQELTSTSPPSSASDILTPSVSGNLLAAEREGRARLLLKELTHNSKLTKVVSLLKDLPPSKEQQMMLAECYLRAGDWSKARNAMNTLKTLMASSAPRDSLKSVKDTVDGYISDSSHIKALILLSSATYLYKLDKNPNNVVLGLQACSISCHHIIKALFKQRGRTQGIAVEIGYEIILQILDDIRSVTGADESARAESEASCLFYIGLSHYEMGKLTEAIGFYE